MSLKITQMQNSKLLLGKVPFIKGCQKPLKQNQCLYVTSTVAIDIRFKYGPYQYCSWAVINLN